MINEKEEFLHTFLDHVHWRESYYYNFMDEANNIYGVCTYGIMPAVMEAHYLVSIWINGKLKIFPEHIKINKFEINPFSELQMEFKKPLNEIQLRYVNEKRKFQIQLKYKGRFPIYKYKGWKFNNILEQEHYEQSGIITGTIIIKDKKYTFNALGQRDHSWGIRDWVKIDNWFWSSIQFKDMAINCWIVEIQGIKRFDGFISRKDKIITFKDVQLENIYDNNQKVPISSTIKLILQNDEIIQIESNRKYHLILPQTTKYGYAEIFETISEFQIKNKNKNKNGYGVAEYLKKY
ncbi:MAG: DUF7065 domain-containing protein [Candidatus Helarchaeota archaeon]